MADDNAPKKSKLKRKQRLKEGNFSTSNRGKSNDGVPPDSSAKVLPKRRDSHVLEVKESKAVSASSKPSASTLAMHRKWKEAAESMGGKGTRIIVNKPQAKKLIFDTLLNSFKPMNITDLYKSLLAVVPSPVLKSCLDDMVVNTTREGEDANEFGNERPYKSSLIVKVGRNHNNTLYFIDYTKLENSGNGLTPESRTKLLTDFENAFSEERELKDILQRTNNERTKLISEPTNSEAQATLLAEEQTIASLDEELENYRKMQVNAPKRDKITKESRSFALHWRKRRRICMDFLEMMEDCSEGAFSVKKCLAGNGQIDIESDESALNCALDIARSKNRFLKHGRPYDEDSEIVSNRKSPHTLIGVKLDTTGAVSRVYL